MSEQAGQYVTAPEAIQFGAQVFKIQTLVDGGMRLTLDLIEPVTPETIVQLFDAKQPGIILQCAMVAINEEAPYKRLRNGKDKD